MSLSCIKRLKYYEDSPLNGFSGMDTNNLYEIGHLSVCLGRCKALAEIHPEVRRNFARWNLPSPLRLMKLDLELEFTNPSWATDVAH